MDPFLVSAIKFAQRNGIGRISIPPSAKEYTLKGGVYINTLNGGISIHGSSSGKTANVKIKHDGDNVGVLFGGANLWVAGGVYDIEVIGNAGENAAFVEFQDAWGFEIKNCFGKNYTNGALIVLRNKKSWTEGAVIENILSRQCKKTVYLVRDSDSGGTRSFYGTTISRLYHQGAVGNDAGIVIGDGTEKNSVKLYSSLIDIGGWNEKGGGHSTVLVSQFSEFIESVCINRNDGFSMEAWKPSSWQVRVADNAFCDVEYRQLGGQLNRLDVTDMPERFGLFSLIGSQAKVYGTSGSRPRVRLKGACIKFGQSELKTLRKLIIKDLPPYSSWLLSLKAVGANLTVADTYAIEVLDGNKIAHVKSLTQQSNGKFAAQTFNELAGGYYSLDNGLTIQLLLDASTFANGVDWTAELMMQ
ncbi:hypothetical protein BHU62_20710 [Serratia marcescens]|uniref:Uncharacterized protein n=1 Tax=Serratia marcescens TaxID=615 RepID=A0A1Q4NVE2_SERMA|nr:hypothetical protein BHU62_20710 [Serratia marcescens]